MSYQAVGRAAFSASASGKPTEDLRHAHDPNWGEAEQKQARDAGPSNH